MVSGSNFISHRKSMTDRLFVVLQHDYYSVTGESK